MKHFLFSLLALIGAAAHADTIPDWLRHPAGACNSTQVIRYLTPGARVTCGLVAFSDLGSTPTTLAGYGITDAQSRVSSSCSTGSAIRVINADGTVTCQSASGGGGAWGSITGTLSDQLDLQAALDGKQPLDSDLTAIAALTTTSYGRGFLPLADAAAGRTYLGLGTLATQSGTFSGTSSGTNTGDQVVPANTTATTHQFFDAYNSTTGAFTKAQPACADLSDAAASCSTDTTAAGNISTGTLSAARLPALTGDVTSSAGAAATTLVNIPTGTTQAGKIIATPIAAPATPSASTAAIYVDSTSKNIAVKDDAGTVKHGVQTDTGTANNYISAISDAGAITKSRPACATLSDAGTGCTATIANYVPTSTTVNGHALSSNVTVTASDVSLGSVTNDAQTKAAIVPNTAPSAGQILVGNAGGTAYAPVTLSGSGATATMSSAGVITLSEIPNATLSNSSVTVAGHSISLGGSSAIACADLSNGATGCSTATGTSGATIPLLNGANTWSGVQSINSGDLALKGATSGTITLNAAATAGTSTITLPGGTTDFSSTGGTSQVVKQTSSGGAFTVGQLAASDLSDGTTGSGGNVVLATGPTMTNPVVGTQSAGDNSTKSASTAFVQRAVHGVNTTVPLKANFTTFGSQITATDKSDRLQLVVSGAAGTVLNGLVQNSISTPYTLDMCGDLIGTPASTSSLWLGIALSDGTKYRTFYVGITNTTTTTAASWQYTADSWTDLTTFSAHSIAAATFAFNNPFCLRVTDNGTTRTFYISQNGRDFTTIGNEATNTFVTPSKVGIALYNGGSATITAKAAIYHWLVTSSVLGDGS